MISNPSRASSDWKAGYVEDAIDPAQGGLHAGAIPQITDGDRRRTLRANNMGSCCVPNAAAHGGPLPHQCRHDESREAPRSTDRQDQRLRWHVFTVLRSSTK